MTNIPFELRGPLLQQTIETMLEREIEADEWDLPIQLYLALERPSLALEDVPGFDQLPVMPSGAVAITPVHFGPGFWSNAPLFIMLNVIAAALSMDGHPPLPADLEEGDQVFGAIIRCEGWMLATKDEDEIEEMRRLQERGQGIADHPKGQEIKTYMAVTLDSTHVVDLVRGDKSTNSRGEGLEGRVVDGLRALLVSIQQEYPTAHQPH